MMSESNCVADELEGHSLYVASGNCNEVKHSSLSHILKLKVD